MLDVAPKGTWGRGPVLDPARRTPRWPHNPARVVTPGYWVFDKGSLYPPYIPRPFPLAEAFEVLSDLLSPYPAASPWRARVVVCCPEKAASWLGTPPPKRDRPWARCPQWECPSAELIAWELGTRRADLDVALWYVAERAGVTSSSLCNIEAGRKAPSSALLTRLRGVLRELEAERGIGAASTSPSGARAMDRQGIGGPGERERSGIASTATAAE